MNVGSISLESRRKPKMTTQPTQPAQPAQSNPISINAPDVSMGPPDRILITDSDLVNALVQSQADALQLLSSEVSPVKLEEISIDSEGRVVIDNSNFAQTLRNMINTTSQTSGLSSKNTICGLHCVQSD
jgi:hypothetical protein